MLSLSQIFFKPAVVGSKIKNPIESETMLKTRRVAANALEGKFKIWVPGGKNHEKMSKAVEDFLAKNPPKK